MPQPTPNFTNFNFCDVTFLLSTEPPKVHGICRLVHFSSQEFQVIEISRCRVVEMCSSRCRHVWLSSCPDAEMSSCRKWGFFFITLSNLKILGFFYCKKNSLIWAVKCENRVVTWYMGSGLKAQNMTGIRAQSKGLRAQKNGIRDHKAFEPESGIRFITRSKNLLSHYFSA